MLNRMTHFSCGHVHPKPAPATSKHGTKRCPICRNGKILRHEGICENPDCGEPIVAGPNASHRRWCQKCSSAIHLVLNRNGMRKRRGEREVSVADQDFFGENIVSYYESVERKIDKVFAPWLDPVNGDCFYARPNWQAPANNA